MQSFTSHTFVSRWSGWCAIGIVLWGFCPPILAATIRLKNGTVLRGKLLVMDSLSDRADKRCDILAESQRVIGAVGHKHSIGCIDSDWHRIYFPLIQSSIIDADLDAASLNGNPVKFTLPRPQRTRTRWTVNSTESEMTVEPFSEFGFRRLTIEPSTKPVHVFQAITEVMPDHLMVESINCRWKIGLGLKAIPVETLDEFLKKQLDSNDPVARLGLVRFYAQARYFSRAFQEVEAAARDFPESKLLLERIQTDLMNDFGNDILLRLRHCQRAGQHVRAETFARQLATLPLDGSVQQYAMQTIRSYEQSRQMIEHAKWFLRECQSKLSNQEQWRHFSNFSTEVDKQLDLDTLSRLEPFLESESVDRFDTEQRMALALSGWVLGSPMAITEFDQALALWHARNVILEYIQSDDVIVHSDRLKLLQSEEKIAPEKIRQLTALLPNLLDVREIEPGKANQVETQSDRSNHYSVVLPAEYSPHHNYPLVIALHSSDHSAEQALSSWAGDDENPDLGADRGYIVIAPDYAETKAKEYSRSEQVHNNVLDCLADARKRFAVDCDRVFLAGRGMGADAAFDIGMAHPDEFAGVLPICGDATNYCKYCWENGVHTAWYVIGKGCDSQGTFDRTSQPIFDKILKSGSDFDFMLVEYLGRNGKDASEEMPKLFDWMDLQVRSAQPKLFKVRSLRKTNNRYFWLTATGLPRDYILPGPRDQARRIKPMEIEATIKQGNIIHLTSPTENYCLRLTPELIDFDKRLIVKIGDHVEFNDFVKPDVGVILEELRQGGDRNRLPLVVVSP